MTTEEAPEFETKELTELQLETLSGDLRDEMLIVIKQMKSPWSMLSENDQRALGERLGHISKDLIGRSARLITDHEFQSARVKLDKIAIIGGDKAEIQGTIKCNNTSENREILGSRTGAFITLIGLNIDEFFGERAPVETDADQPDLPMGQGSDDQGADDQTDADKFAEQCEKAEQVVRKEGKCSTSFVQRRLAIGYNRAAKIVEELERRGVVTEADSKGKRSIVPIKDEAKAEKTEDKASKAEPDTAKADQTRNRFAKETIERATTIVRSEGKANATVLMASLKCSFGEAKALLSVLEGMGIVSEADDMGDHGIIRDGGSGQGDEK